MAFDAAASAASSPTAGASAAVKPVGRKSDAADPFGALLAMLDQANTQAPAPETAVATVPQAGKAPAPSDAKDAAAKEDKPAEAPAGDALALAAAMMIPAPPTAATVPATGAAPAPTGGAAPVPTAPVTAVVEAGAPVAEGFEQAAEPSAETAPPAPTLAKADPKAGKTDRPAAQAAIAAPAPPPTPAPAPAEPQLAAAEAQAEAAAPQTAQAAVTAQNAEPLKTPADGLARAEAAANPPAPGAEAPQDGAPDPNAQDRRNGAPAEAQAARTAQTRSAPTPDAARSFAELDVAGPAPQTAAPPANAPLPPPPSVAAAAAPAVTAQAIAAPVRGAPETVALLAAQMIQRLDGQITRFDLSLHPQSLGRVDVRIEIGAKGALKARMAFDDAASAHELSGRHAELRAALQSAGFDVPEGAITYDIASGGGSGAGGETFAERQDASGHAAPAFNHLAEAADQDAAAGVQAYFRAAGSSGLDIRV